MTKFVANPIPSPTDLGHLHRNVIGALQGLVTQLNQAQLGTGTSISIFPGAQASSGGGGTSTSTEVITQAYGYVTDTITSNAVTPNLATALSHRVVLDQATRITINNPIVSPGSLVAGFKLHLYLEQDSTGNRPTPTWGSAFGSDLGSEWIDGSPSTRSVYLLTYHSDSKWHIDSFTTGRSL